ncbi:lytic transglycosylase domain-containing protein [Enterobacter mori]|uniref:lytic transglycosylase domain-containing protein n=1 Tax=Enterobacter mori TaxID=539813 RepID=UPI00398A8C47
MAFDIKQYTIDEAKRQGIDPDFALATMGVESGGNPNAVSRTGAIGAFQMFPAAVKDVGGDYDAMKKDPALQVQYGVSYLKQKLKQAGGDYAKALGYYNQGKAGFDKQLASGNLAPEVVNYVNRPEFAPFVKDSQITQIANPIKSLSNTQQQNSKFSSGALFRGGDEQLDQATAEAVAASPNAQIQQANALGSISNQTVQDIAAEKERIANELKKQQSQNKNEAIQTAMAAGMGLIFGQHKNTTTTTNSGVSRGASSWGNSTGATLERLQGGFTPNAFNNFNPGV